MAETRLSGRGASAGIGAGPAMLLAVPKVARSRRKNTQEEIDALESAVAAAAREIETLADSQQGEAADMLQFQVALLTDETLLQQGFDLIRQGMAADAAWHEVIRAEIAIYLDGGDENFAARTADLYDIEARVLAALGGTGPAPPPPAGAVLVGVDITPSRFIATDWSKGGAIALAGGSSRSHVAMLARAQGVPMVVGLGQKALALTGTLLVDGAAGEVVADPSAATQAEFQARRQRNAATASAAVAAAGRPAITACGTKVRMLANVGNIAELDGIDPTICDGVGLTRTEFLFGPDTIDLPDEDEQFAAYATVLRWAGGRPVTIRTLDAGGDKPVGGLTPIAESNPFLGLRGIRLSLTYPKIFRVQLRALARAAALGPLKVMLPMVSLPSELEDARRMFHEEVAGLHDDKVKAAMPQLGIMVEVPAAALAIDTFDAAFVSIGSNDLTQYVMAAARDIGDVADLVDVRHEAVLRLIRMVVEAARVKSIEASLCGDAGGDPDAIPLLLRAGLRVFSAAPAMIGRAKLAIAETSLA
jgi:phosphotransferase system enzyme I (PtsI)